MKTAARERARHRARRPILLVFGESEHDRAAVRHLTEGLRPDLAGRVETRRAPLVLIKNANPTKARSNAEDIAKLVRQENAARNVVAVLAHADCDALEPAHIAAAKKVEEALAAAGCPGTSIGVTPAWELEAWWLVFPDAVASIVEGWREPNDWIGKDTGQVANAKEALTRALRPKLGRHARPRQTRDYHEADSIEIARNVVSMDLLRTFDDDHRELPGKGASTSRTRSRSFGAFRRKVLALPAGSGRPGEPSAAG